MRVRSWMLLPLRRPLDFRGRSRRREFWLWSLFVLGGVAAAGWVDRALEVDRLGRAIGARGPFSALFVLASVIPSLAVAVRRLHDANRRGWWLFLPVLGVLSDIALVFAMVLTGLDQGREEWFGMTVVLVPLAALGWCFALLCLPGTGGPNRFGPDPKDPLAGLDLADVFR